LLKGDDRLRRSLPQHTNCGGKRFQTLGLWPAIEPQNVSSMMTARRRFFLVSGRDKTKVVDAGVQQL
jgi:hypothetical protein